MKLHISYPRTAPCPTSSGCTFLRQTCLNKAWIPVLWLPQVAEYASYLTEVSPQAGFIKGYTNGRGEK